MAEGLLSHALAAENGPLRDIRVTSAGVAARPGEIVSENAVVSLKKVGIDISGHRSRNLTQEMLDGAAVVLCMTETHRAIIQYQASPVPERLYLFRGLLPPPTHQEISDPYGGSIRIYEACRDEMVEAIPSIIAHLRGLVKA